MQGKERRVCIFSVKENHQDFFSLCLKSFPSGNISQKLEAGLSPLCCACRVSTGAARGPGVSGPGALPSSGEKMQESSELREQRPEPGNGSEGSEAESRKSGNI